MITKLSVVIITLNEELNIERCLTSVKDIADEIIVVDEFSRDRTVEICKTFGCKVYQREFKGYGDQKQFAVDQASNDWVLSIDADEEVSEGLKKEISDLFQPSISADVPLTNYNGFMIPFSLLFMGRIMKHSGLGNEVHLRLFNRNNGHFTLSEVHETIKVEGKIGTLKGKMIHRSYRDIAHHIEKSNIYTSQAAEGYSKKGRKFSKFWVGLKFPVTFFIYYVIRGGFLDGYPGFMWAFMAAFYTTIKMAKTIEIGERS
ncbi:MAG: glycosyltransferase family 2 protein [Bacteroidota bacterium]